MTVEAAGKPEDARRCPVCGGVRAHRFLFEKWGYPIVECTDCRLAATVLPEGFDPASIYSADYFEGGRSDGYGDYPAEKPARLIEARQRLKRIAKHRARGGRLLEIGCAYGFFLGEASRHYDTFGIDVAESAVEKCRAAGLKAVAGELSASTFEKPFDVVVMQEVIEHLADPEETLRAVMALLRPGGLLTVYTGDWRSWSAQFFGRNWRLMTPPQHLFFFSETNLVGMLHRLGFEVREARRIGKYVPASLAIYQAMRWLGMKKRPKLAWTHKMAVPVSLSDAVWVVASKPLEEN